MEIVVIVLIAGAAILAVLVPLVRGGAETDSMLDPLPQETAGAETDADAMAPIEQEVLRYRAALHNGTVCGKCAAANPAGSRFCAECGRPLGARPVEKTT
jgi:ribosomal protein L40E